MNPYAISPFLAAGLNFLLVFWVFYEAPRNRVRSTFLLWNTWIGLWNLSVAVGYLWTDAHSAFLWYKIVSSCVIGFTAPCFLNFVVHFTKSESPLNLRRVRWAFASGFLFLLMGSMTPLLMNRVIRYPWGFYPGAGRAEFTFGWTFAVIIGFSFTLLWRALKNAAGYRRNQIKYIIVGAAITFGSGVTNFLPLRGVSVYPVGNVLNSLYSLLVAYAIVEYGLMDIRVVLRRGLVYGFLSGGLTAVYLTVVALLRHLFVRWNVVENYSLYTAAVPLTVVLAPAMKARIEPFLERAPFWKTYRYSEAFRNFGHSILTVLDIATVAARVVDQMTSLLSTDAGALYLQRTEQEAFYRIHSKGFDGPIFVERTHPVVDLLAAHKAEVIKEEALWKSDAHLAQGEPRRRLEAWPYALVLPLFTDTRLFAFIALGQKSSGDMFNADDIELLKALSAQAAVALRNAQGVADIEAFKKHRDMTLLGELATEMAHELTKPLTRIMNEESRLETTVAASSHPSLKKIEKEALRAAGILECFAMLSPHRTLERQEISVIPLVEDVLTTLGVTDDHAIRIDRRWGPLSDVPVNYSQMVQALTNIIQNAWQAMPDGGRLTVEAKTSGDSDATVLELSITDTGAGIPMTIQDKIFNPFFTTKKEQGGRGVGLAISRAMIERQGGRILLQSPVDGRGGTRVTIVLPLTVKEDIA